ncbi:MAG: hypothetical protein VR70_17080 [Rhodospirillaceae bacterium BRH_c57]|nr:MAG: hypothetical protein VR70_17080 [Rhodospirillaceae bacterium BRH_c57]
MMVGQNNNAVMVMTAKGLERMLEDGGSHAWVLSPSNAARMDYVVCVQNRHNGSLDGATEEHGKAFMIGKIDSIKAVGTDDNGNARYMIKMSAYCHIDGPMIDWGGRNPVRYINVMEVTGLDVDQLDFRPMPSSSGVGDPTTVPAQSAAAPLTISAAKAGLAATFGVAEGAIEIIIRA